MDDKDFYENLLLITKGLCGLCEHGAIESSTESVFKLFKESLMTQLEIQRDIYKTMEEENWYQISNATVSKIDKAYKKFSK